MSKRENKRFERVIDETAKDKDKGQKFLNTTSRQLLADITSSSDLVKGDVQTNEDLIQYQKEKQMRQNDHLTQIIKENIMAKSDQPPPSSLLEKQTLQPNTKTRSGSLKETTAEKGGISLSEQRQPEKESIERKSYDWYEKQIKQSDEKVKDATFKLARQPENQERKDALEAALNEKTALVLERDFGVSSPKLVDLRRQQENLGDVQKHFSEHIALNEAFKAELAQLQKSLPKDFMSAGTKETLKKLFDTPSQNKVVMQSKLDYLKNPELVKNADLSNQQIKNALTEALSHKDKDIRLKAIASPQMKDEWLEKVVEKHRCPETVCEAKNALQEKAVAKQFSGSASIATLQNRDRKSVV